MGNFTISDQVFRQIIEYLAYKTPAIDRLGKLRITKYEEGPSLYMEVIVVYGYNIKDSLMDFSDKCKREIEKLTAMNISSTEIVAKAIVLPEEGTLEE